MRTTITLSLALACAGLVPMQSAPAETLRCGSVLIEPGDDAWYVLEKCGDPTPRAATEPLSARGISGYLYQVGIARAGRWRYHRAAGQFTVVLSIADDGRVQAIEFERVRD
jgi:Protein of unknown function (DUF2845)